MGKTFPETDRRIRGSVLSSVTQQGSDRQRFCACVWFWFKNASGISLVEIYFTAHVFLLPQAQKIVFAQTFASPRELGYILVTQQRAIETAWYT